jgi:hypothetical protein
VEKKKGKCITCNSKTPHIRDCPEPRKKKKKIDVHVEEETVPVVQEETVSVIQEKTHPVVEEETVPVVQEATVPVVEEETVPEEKKEWKKKKGKCITCNSTHPIRDCPEPRKKKKKIDVMSKRKLFQSSKRKLF